MGCNQSSLQSRLQYAHDRPKRCRHTNATILGGPSVSVARKIRKDVIKRTAEEEALLLWLFLIVIVILVRIISVLIRLMFDSACFIRPIVVLACVIFIVVVVVVVRRMPNTAPPDLNCTARYKFPLTINHCIPRCPKSVRCDARCCLYRSSYLYHRHHQREKAPFPSSPQCRMLLLLRLAEYGFLLTGYVQKKLPT